MHVLHVFKSYSPTYGGVETYLQVLAEGSREHGVQATALVVNDTRRTVQEVVNGVRVIRAGRLGAVSTAPLSPWLGGLFRGMCATADLVHLHAPYVPLEVAYHLLTNGTPFVVGYHSDIVKQRVLGRMYRPVLLQVLRRARLLSSATENYVATSPVLRRFAEKCRIIPYGVPLARFVPSPDVCAAAGRLRADHAGSPLVLFVGRLRHYKGLDVLLSAMRDVPDAHLLVVGTGPMEARWRRHAEQCDVADRVTFLGECTDARLLAAYRAADVLVLPSTNRAEAFGIVLLEAMASERPVISTELGTGTSFVNADGDTGLVVPPRQPGALAAAIHRILGDRDLRSRMGRAALTRARERFSRELMLERTVAFYSEALGR